MCNSMKCPYESPEIVRFRGLTLEIIASTGQWWDVRLKNFLQVENMLITYLDLKLCIQPRRRLVVNEIPN